MVLRFILVAVALVLLACGDETETMRVTERYTLDMLGTGVSLTEERCDSARVGQLLYVGDSSSIYYCTGKVWEKVNGTDGKDGHDGKDGADGADGKRGKYGTSGTECYIDKFVDGFSLGCGATKAVVRYNFEIPDTCDIVLRSDSSYVLICGKDSSTLLQGEQGDAGDICKQTDIGGGQVRLVCGNDSVITYKAQCGETPFDPDGLMFCYGDTLVARCNTHAYDIKKQFCYGDSLVPLCGGESYNPEEKFCYLDSLVPFCGGKSYDLKKQFCYVDSLVFLCGGESYNPEEKFCYLDSLVPFCGGKSYDPKKQFCCVDSLVPLCGGKMYDPKEQFCYVDSLVPLCGGKTYDPKKQFCYADSLVDFCDGETYDLALQFCYIDSLVFLCGEKTYDPKEQFCDDRNGKVYKYTKIGDAIWMAQHLDYKVPNSFCAFPENDDDFYCGTGRLYPWTVAMAKDHSECGAGNSCSVTYPHQGVCPNGWHMPTKVEWIAMMDSTGNYGDLYYWDESVELFNWEPYSYGLNASGFSALPVGIIPIKWNEESRLFERRGELYNPNGADFWTSTERSEENVHSCYIFTNKLRHSYFHMIDYPKDAYARLVRCVKD